MSTWSVWKKVFCRTKAASMKIISMRSGGCLCRITRAQKELTFTLCKERRQYGELVRPEPSRFLLELPQDDLIWEQERKVVSAEERMQKGQSHLANLKAMMAAKRGK